MRPRTVAAERGLDDDALAAVCVSPTISWPGTNGVLVSVARCSEALPLISARSEPQIPVSRGRTCTQSGPGARGGRTSSSASAPAPGRLARVATYFAIVGV